MYGLHPKVLTDVTSLPLPHKMEEQVAKYIAQANHHRKDIQFEEGDLVLIRLRLERFPTEIYNKLHARRDGPFKILKKLGTNSYLVDLPT